jgi:hypothetical protein
MLSLFLSASMVLLCSLAHAQSESSIRAPFSSETSKSSSAGLWLNVERSQYVSYGRAYYRAGAADNNLSFALRVDEQTHWRGFKFQLSGKNEFSATENWNYADVHDLHADWQAGETTISLGRKLDAWSEWEKDWHQGLFQPRYLENKLRPEFAGLTGIFASQRLGSVKITAGYLPLYVPDFNPRFTVENNKLVSRNPWFSPPASKFSFQDVPGDLHYSVRTPEISDIVFHQGAIAKIEFDRGRYFARLSAAYKPVQQWMLGFPSFNQFKISATDDFMSIQITPRVIYQRVLSADQLVQAGAWTLGASAAYENPLDNVSEDYTAASAGEVWIYALSASRALETEGKNAARLQIGLMKLTGGHESDRGKFAQGDGKTLFERRYQFYEAYSAGVSKPWRGLGRLPLETGLKLIYDRLQNGGVVSFNCGMNFSKELRADLQIDYLGLFEGRAEISDGFLADYRANDRVGIGMSYAF